MKSKIFTFAVHILLINVLVYPQIKYPHPPKGNVKDNYFGTVVADPYRWMENDTSAAVRKWIEEENKITFDYLDKIPFRDKIKERLEKLYDYQRFSAPFKGGDRYFFFKNDGLQNQSILYIQNDLESTPQLFLDPNKFSEDGTVSLTTYAFSKDGRYFAYGIASGGSDWNEFHIMDVQTRKNLSDDLKWIKFSGIAWYKDGFFYSRYPMPAKGKELTSSNEFQKVYYHKIGNPQSDDIFIYGDDNNPKMTFTAQTTEDERFLVIYPSQGTSNNAVLVSDLSNPNSKVIPVIANFNNNYSVVDNIGDKLIVITDKNAPRYRLVFIDPLQPQEANWKEVLPEEKSVLQSATIAGGKLISLYMQDANSHVYISDLDGKNKEEIKLPSIGTISEFIGKKEDKTAFYSFTSFTFPPTIYRFNVDTKQSTLYRKPDLDINFDDYMTEQVFYKSKDGTKIPMFIVYKKGIERNGKNPTYLYSYGGFNISLNPTFSASRLVLLENGGIFAMPNIRGGGEYGEAWHKAGTKLHKQNVFDDFIYAAKYLIKEKYTSPKYLAISGASNGGLLVGAVTNQHPELFRVAFPAVGVMDMLRFQKFTIGWAWVSDYGSSGESKQMFQALYKYSPLHNISSKKNYPSMLITTADHDDRVVPAHSFKYAATLQEKYNGKNPILIRIETRAGHGAGKPISKVIQEQADMWSFMFYNMGITPKY
jgi:prolyl oligopeptidase